MKFLFLFFLSTGLLASEIDQKFKVSLKFKNHLEGLKLARELDLDVAGINLNDHLIDVIIGDEDLKNITSRNIEYIITEVKGVTKKLDDEYKNPDEVEMMLKSLNEEFPDLTHLVSIGLSVEGRNIWAIKISDNAKIDEAEPVVLLNSMHHAREVMTPEITLDAAEYLLKNYQTVQEVQSWVNDNEIWIVPMLNVDGNNRVWTEDIWWRKNVSQGHGVDINRNYPATWGACNGSSTDPNSQTYRGPHAGSEPETQALMKLVENIRPVFNISYHSYSEIVIYPFGCKGQRTPNREVVESIGAELGQKIGYKPGTSWELLYSVDGGDIDWMYKEFQVIPYVIEVNSSWEGFHPNYERTRNRTVEKNREGWMYIIRKLYSSGINGKVLSMNKGKNYSFEIYKDKNLFQEYKIQNDGFYHVVLSPGQYTIHLKEDLKTIKSQTISILDKQETLNF